MRSADLVPTPVLTAKVLRGCASCATPRAADDRKCVSCGAGLPLAETFDVAAIITGGSAPAILARLMFRFSGWLRRLARTL